MMTRRTVSFPARLLAIAAIATAFFGPGTAQAEPVRPADDAEILERLPTPANGERRALRGLRSRLSADPENLALALDLARRYLAAGRAEADPRYHGYAEAALRPWLDLSSPPVDVLVLRAVMHQNRHHFDAALADLDRVLAVRPSHAQAHLSRAFVLQVQGRLAEAQESCRRLPTAIDRLIAATCRARVASLGGRATEGYAELSTALEQSRDADRGLRLWALTNLAEIAHRLGEISAAEAHFQAALALGQRDAYLLAAYADLMLDQGRYAEVRQLLAEEAQIDGLLLRLTIAERALGYAVFEANMATLAARFDAGRRRGDLRHLREEARSAQRIQDDPSRALDLALENWRTQREPADALLVLEAALAAGKPDKAGGVLSWLEESRLEDTRLQRLADALRAEGS